VPNEHNILILLSVVITGSALKGFITIHAVSLVSMSQLLLRSAVLQAGRSWFMPP